ncbi:MAG: type II toxin-antitoxin system RelB/DinJ family antitoxin [Bacteroides sp.]|nr:type II toxin-antitoxin system RelB/DinJ family antitoxin [Eubacterium sp.]MCM1418410.1 type II toxin-antitoxin system RelB/DinJ family antitoxin [Roseburia sp.]MCM1461568.1 type II toxin-antitoxin system RelB/DinJ family antitoxin [Bacteroides sp.]
MSEQALVQARMDKELRDEVAEIYEQLGLDIPTAIRMFFTRTKLVRGIPFDTTLPQKAITRSDAAENFKKMREAAADVPEMSLDEINGEISASRKERGQKGAAV